MATPDMQTVLILILIVIWAMTWKGIALWMAARRNHLIWFVIILIINTLGILDIIYIFWIGRQYKVESEETSPPPTTKQNTMNKKK